MIPLSPALAAQIDELDRLAKTRDDAWQISRDVGEFLAAVAVAHRAKVIVEVGTSYGFSGLWWAAALGVTGGHRHAIDIAQKKFDSSKATFAAAGVADRITNHLGDGAKVLPTIAGPIDLAFIDADKPATQNYYEQLWPKIRVGGALLIDNVLSHKDEMAGVLESIRNRTDNHLTIVPMRAGVAWAVKIG